MPEPELKIPTVSAVANLPAAVLSSEQQEDATGYLLDRWQAGELSTRDVAKRLGMTYYDFAEFASKRGYSLVPSGPNEEAIAAYERSARDRR